MIGKGKCPWSILGVPRSASKETIQKAFAKLAMQFHPDTASNARDASLSTEYFIRVRNAYEQIRDGTSTRDGGSFTRHGNPSSTRQDGMFSEEAFLEYFFQQTGLRISSSQRRELLHLYRTRIPGGKYIGPTWDIARRLAVEQNIFLSGCGTGAGWWSSAGDGPRTGRKEDIKTDADRRCLKALRRKRQR